MTEDEMVGWHHRLDGHEFEQTLGDDEGQGSLAWCSPWSCKELDTTELDHRKSKSSRKTSTSALLTMPKPLTVWVTMNCGKF